MRTFRQYFESKCISEDEDVKKSLSKLPKGHQALAKGFVFRFEQGNTLAGDDGHVGFVKTHPRKEIRISAPWRYSREHTVLHEIAHLVFEKFVRNTPLQKQWEDIVKRTKKKKKGENAEELFCHSYACHYSAYCVDIHDNPEWHQFIKNLPE